MYETAGARFLLSAWIYAGVYTLEFTIVPYILITIPDAFTNP